MSSDFTNSGKTIGMSSGHRNDQKSSNLDIPSSPPEAKAGDALSAKSKSEVAGSGAKDSQATISGSGNPKAVLAGNSDAKSTISASNDPNSTISGSNESYGRAGSLSDSLDGQILAERYSVERQLGSGGMGAVYLARHITLEKNVAIKVLHSEFARKDDLVQRFLQEAKAASRIRHDHVIDITDFGQTPDGLVFFAMEYLDGKDLGNLLRQGPLTWERTRDIFSQVCSALSAAHAKGIIHRDLKPDNIFLMNRVGDPDFVKLLDFGIAKLTDAPEDGPKLTRTGTLFGTPEYMAPEQAAGREVDKRTDVYAMGCILFQMLTGNVPFQAANFMATLNLHLFMEVPECDAALENAGAPPCVKKIVHRAMEKEPDDRFASVDEMLAALDQACGDDAGAATASRARRPITKPGIKNATLKVSSTTKPTTVQRKIPVPTKAVAQPAPLVAPRTQSVNEPQRNATPWLAGGAVLIVVIAAAVLATGKEESPSRPEQPTTLVTQAPRPVAEEEVAPAQPTPLTDKVRVRSNPPGATLHYLDRDYAAPITIAIEPGASRRIKVEKAGYESIAVDIQPGQSELLVELEAIVPAQTAPTKRRNTSGSSRPKRSPTPTTTKPAPTTTPVPVKPEVRPSSENPDPWAN